VRRFRERGYAATGLAEVLADSGAPRGSLYHHFPGGKAELGAAAVAAAGESVERVLRDLAREAPDAPAFLEAYAERLALWLEASAWRAGCPIATTLLETAADEPALAMAGEVALASWHARIAERFRADGLPDAEAAARAEIVVAAVEGALLLARVQRSAAPIRRVLGTLAASWSAASPRILAGPPTPESR
jgi:TetR/AcrR family transcriptional repressor of lmrAB and yxaGH operons